MKALFFDLDQTILDRTQSVEGFLRWLTVEKLSGELSEPDRFVRRFIELDNNGLLWKDKVFAQLVIEFGIREFNVEQLLALYVNEFQHHCVPRQHLALALKRLDAMGLVMGLITNGPSPFQQNNFNSLGVSRYFKTAVVSGAVGVRKPDAAIFDLACQQAGVAASESVFVGDNPVADIQGAAAVGMYTVFIPTNVYPVCEQADVVCTDLAFLPEIVSQAR